MAGHLSSTLAMSRQFVDSIAPTFVNTTIIAGKFHPNMKSFIDNWGQVSSSIISLVVTLFLLAIYTVWKLFVAGQTYANAPIACIDPKRPKATLPKARDRFRSDAITMLQEGYRQFKGRPWYVPSPLGERLMIPSKYVEELKNAPVNEVDFVATFFEMFEGRYTTMGSRSTLHPRVAKHELNQNMGELSIHSPHDFQSLIPNYSGGIRSYYGRDQRCFRRTFAHYRGYVKLKPTGNGNKLNYNALDRVEARSCPRRHCQYRRSRIITHVRRSRSVTKQRMG